MKKLIFKLSIAIVFIIMLFASTSFADEVDIRFDGYYDGKIEMVDGEFTQTFAPKESGTYYIRGNFRFDSGTAAALVVLFEDGALCRSYTSDDYKLTVNLDKDSQYSLKFLVPPPSNGIELRITNADYGDVIRFNDYVEINDCTIETKFSPEESGIYRFWAYGYQLNDDPPILNQAISGLLYHGNTYFAIDDYVEDNEYIELELTGGEVCTITYYNFESQGEFVEDGNAEFKLVIMNKDYTGEGQIIVSEKASTGEFVLTRIFLSIGDVFLWAIRKALGNDLTIDNLIFNRFEKTSLSFYTGGGSQNNVSYAVINTVNKWYNNFLKFTNVFYIIILVYIGIMIILTSGTPKQDKAKKYFTDWIIGLVIMMFVPYYGFPLLFKANDALVQYIGEGSSRLISYFELIQLQRNYFYTKLGDSYTIEVENLQTLLRTYTEEEYETIEDIQVKLGRIDQAIRNADKEPFSTIHYKNDYTQDEREEAANFFKREALYEIYDYYKDLRKSGVEDKKAFILAYRISIISLRTYTRENECLKAVLAAIEKFYLDETYLYGYYDPDFTPQLELYCLFAKLYKLDLDIDRINYILNETNNDILGAMRVEAGKTGRFIFAIIWFMLIFQLIGLTIIYFKRIFVIAILMAIFPIVMLFYCIDKMVDGSAQTLSLWFKEFLTNIFIQSIHAVIYVVLVEMGLSVYEGGTTNWIYLAMAMFAILPAETIMKEIFDLNGNTVGKIAGSFTKTMMAAGALVTLAKSTKTSKDKSIKDAHDKRMKRLQNSQSRADSKARTRAMNRAVKNPGGKGAPITGYQKAREKVYEGSSAIRQGIANASPKVARVVRGARNVAAVGNAVAMRFI